MLIRRGYAILKFTQRQAILIKEILTPRFRRSLTPIVLIKASGTNMTKNTIPLHWSDIIWTSFFSRVQTSVPNLTL